MIPTASTEHAVVKAIRECRFRVQDELGLQEAVADALRGAGLPVEREVRLSVRDRIDFVVNDVGLELKVKGSLRRVKSQLERYATHARLATVMLVTTKCALSFEPYSYCGKRVRSLTILRGLA